MGAERTSCSLIFSPAMWESVSCCGIGEKVGKDLEINPCLWSQTGLESSPSSAILLAV